jgi:site-specific recombinase XerD
MEEGAKKAGAISRCKSGPGKLANDGQDARAVQHYLGHKNIQHTVRYTELSPERFKSFWGD